MKRNDHPDRTTLIVGPSGLGRRMYYYYNRASIVFLVLLVVFMVAAFKYLPEYQEDRHRAQVMDDWREGAGTLKSMDALLADKRTDLSGLLVIDHHSAESPPDIAIDESTVSKLRRDMRAVYVDRVTVDDYGMWYEYGGRDDDWGAALISDGFFHHAPSKGALKRDLESSGRLRPVDEVPSPFGAGFELKPLGDGWYLYELSR